MKTPKHNQNLRLHNDRQWAVSYNSHPTGVVKPVYAYPIIPLTAKGV